MTLLELQAKANPILVNFWNALTTRQDAYFTKNGRYFQLLISPTTPVVDGVDSDFTLRAPTYETKVADYNLSFTDKIPFQVEVHQHGDKGYTAYVWARLPNGNIYLRSRSSDNSDSGWSHHLSPSK
jgi:hypothetical protein